MRRTGYSGPRRTGPVAAIGVAVLAGALGVPSASGGQSTTDDVERTRHETAELLYHCETESKRRDLHVRVGLSLPDAGSVGTPVEPADVTIRMTLGEAVGAELAERGASSVTGTARLTVPVEETGAQEDGQSQPLAFPESTIAPTPLPESGKLELTGSGDGTPVTPRAAGDMTFSAGRLTLVLGWRSAGEPTPEDGTGEDTAGDTGGTGDAESGDAESSGAADGVADGAAEGGGSGAAATDDTDANAPALSVFDCAPAPDQDTEIGTVEVNDEGSTPPTSSPRNRSDKDGRSPDEDARSTPFGTAAQEGEVPEECRRIREEGVAWCAYIGGYTNVDSLRAATRIEPGILNLSVGNFALCEDRFGFCQTTIGELSYRGEKKFPPTRNSFHAFEFMPTAATVELTQVSPMEIDIFFLPTPPYEGMVSARVEVSVRVYDVTVNGVPMDVGDDCRTEHSMAVSLTATYPTYDVDAGGILDGYADMPSFSGCGVGEDLDSLMTGLISGEDYYVKMTQGPICEIRNGNACPPSIPELKR